MLMIFTLGISSPELCYTAASLQLIFFGVNVNTDLCCLWSYANLKQEEIRPTYFVEKALKILLSRIPRVTNCILPSVPTVAPYFYMETQGAARTYICYCTNKTSADPHSAGNTREMPIFISPGSLIGFTLEY